MAATIASGRGGETTRGVAESPLRRRTARPDEPESLRFLSTAQRSGRTLRIRPRPHSMKRLALSALATAALAPTALAQAPYTNFESTVVHPVRVSADGSRLYAAIPSGDRLAVFSLLDPARPALLREIPVGLRPASVAVRTNTEVWVCNLLSDSVSVVDTERGIVLDTLRIGDEPSDIVFAGGKAFVTEATRDRVQVYDATTRASLGSINLFGKEPRALAVDGSGQRVYALSRRSGNGTTLLKTSLAPPQPAPSNPALPPAPQTGLIVRADDPAHAAQLPFTLPDLDVFEIDAGSQTVLRSFARVGTTNFDLVVHPQTGVLWVANSDARNLVRFVPNLRGHVVDHRVTTILPGGAGTVVPFDLNAGISYTQLPNPQALATALADPTGLALDAGNSLLYVAAQGSDRIGVVDLQVGAVVDRIELSGTSGALVNTAQKRGPRALALHPTAGFLYCWNRLSESLSVVATGTRAVVHELLIASHDAEPPAVRAGRKFLYDAKLSGNGTISCASCHVDGEEDGLAWDLGDPSGQLTTIPIAFQQGAIAGGPTPANFPPIHPMKGPLMTQPLRKLEGRPHWRGDLASFADFNATFPSLLGGSLLAAADLATFGQWAAAVVYPPNPNQNLDRTRTTQQQQGFQAFSNGLISCISCHVQPSGSNGMVRDQPQGTFQPMKIAPLRNYYRKSGLSKSGGQPLKMGFGLFKDGEAGVLQDINGMGGGGTGTPPAAQFLLAWDTGTAPAVGLQVQLDATAATLPLTTTNLALLEARALTGELDLIVRGQLDGVPAGFWFQPAQGLYRPDRAQGAQRTRAELLQLAGQGRLIAQATGVMPGEGTVAIDRDGDGVRDGDAAALSYGAPSLAACGQTLRLSANSSPERGNGSFGTGFAPGSLGLLGLAGSSGNLPVLGITLHLALDPTLVVLGLAIDGRGTAHYPLAIPNSAGLVGYALFAQLLATEPCSGGFTSSAGLSFVVQP
jgi:YVTN family beta-propeller protein